MAFVFIHGFMHDPFPLTPLRKHSGMEARKESHTRHVTSSTARDTQTSYMRNTWEQPLPSHMWTPSYKDYSWLRKRNIWSLVSMHIWGTDTVVLNHGGGKSHCLSSHRVNFPHKTSIPHTQRTDVAHDRVSKGNYWINMWLADLPTLKRDRSRHLPF